MSAFKKLFTKETPDEEVKRWTRQLRSEQRKIDTQVTKIRREEQKVKLSMKQAAKQDDQHATRMLAKELIRSRKAVNRMYTCKTQMSSVSMQLQNQLSQTKLAGTMSKSAEIMKDMNAIMNVREMQQGMMAMSKEMQKAGLIDEVMNDTLDDALDEDISDSELEDEVRKVVAEVTMGKMEGASVRQNAMPQRVPSQQQQEEESDEDEDLMQRFDALRAQ